MVAEERFRQLAEKASRTVGSSWCFTLALALIVAWAVTGPVFHYSESWQLVVNTGTTIVTFLMVFLIQNTQNRDAHVMHLKLAELIRAQDAARNSLMCAEHLTDAELQQLQQEFDEFAREKLAAKRDSRAAAG